MYNFLLSEGVTPVSSGRLTWFFTQYFHINHNMTSEQPLLDTLEPLEAIQPLRIEAGSGSSSSEEETSGTTEDDNNSNNNNNKDDEDDEEVEDVEAESSKMSCHPTCSDW